MKRLESTASLFVTLVEKRGSILDFIDPWIPACARMTEGETGITKRPIFCYWLFLFRGFPCYSVAKLLLLLGLHSVLNRGTASSFRSFSPHSGKSFKSF